MDGDTHLYKTAMTNFTLRPLLAIFLFSILVECKKSSTSGDVVSTSGVDSLILVYESTGDSVASAWKRMTEDDDEKLFHIKRLLEEVTYTGKFDQVALDSLMAKHSTLVALRYDQKTMSDSDLIDEYDVLTAQVIDEVISFSQSNPDYSKYPLMEELIMDIMEADNRVLFHRIKYDNFCREFNDLVKDQVSALSAAGEEQLEELPLFTLSE